MARTRFPTRQSATRRSRRNPTTYKVVPDLKQPPHDPADSEKIRKKMLSFLQEVLKSGLNSEVLDESKLLEDLDNHQWSRQELIQFVARHKMFWTGSDTVQSTFGTLNDIPPHTPYVVVGNQRKVLQLPETWVTTENERRRKQQLSDRPSFQPPSDADYYQILGVARDASPEEIKKAFRQIARESHPDITGNDPASTERFKTAQLAYETLNDRVSRSVYDRRLGAPRIRSDEEEKEQANRLMLKQILNRIKVVAIKLLQSKAGPLWYRMDETTKDDLIQSSTEKWLSNFDFNRLTGRPSDETKQESQEILEQATRDAWNELRAAKQREQAGGEQIEKLSDVDRTTPEELFAFRQTTNAQLDRMSLIDEIARQSPAGATKANILRMHQGEQVLPHQPASTIGRYGGNSYSGWTSKAYGHLFGERWIFKVGGILYKPTGPEGTTPSYHGPPKQYRVVLIDDRPMMILTRPRSDARGKITLLPLDDSRQTVQIEANPLDLPLAPCPTCEDIARYLRIRGLSGPRVQRFIDVDFARMAREKGFDIFSTKES